jgi:hypothetical protein
MMNEFDSASALESPAPEARDARPWLITFGDLICLLLSVFVLLENASHIQADKAKHAIQSLGSSLAFGTAIETKDVNSRSASEALVGAGAVRDRLASHLHTAFPDLKMEELPPGTVLRVTLPGARVFAGNDLNPAFLPVVAGIADEIQHGAPGIRFDIESVVLGAGESEPLIARASVLARELVASGAPKTGVAAGIGKAGAEEVRITIRGHAEDEARVDFRHLVTEP